MLKAQLFPVPGMSGDERVRVFRRVFDATDDYEGLEVDAYIIITERYLVVLDTMLCPADVAGMMSFVEPLEGRDPVVEHPMHDVFNERPKCDTNEDRQHPLRNSESGEMDECED